MAAWNVIALSIFLFSLGSAGYLLYRYLPRPNAARRLVCAVCGLAAEKFPFNSFQCPGCKHDVRDHGLLPYGSFAPHTPLLSASVFTVFLIPVATFATAALAASIRPFESTTFTRSLVPASKAYSALSVESLVSGVRGENGRGMLTVELFLLEGRTFTLTVILPANTCRVVDDDGREQTLKGPLSFETVKQLYAAAGLDLGDSRINEEARTAYEYLNDARRVGFQGSQSHNTGSFTYGGGSSHNGRIPEPRIICGAIGAACLIWVTGLSLILRYTVQRLPRVQEGQ